MNKLITIRMPNLLFLWHHRIFENNVSLPTFSFFCYNVQIVQIVFNAIPNVFSGKKQFSIIEMHMTFHFHIIHLNT